jgi:hypothetical protein
MAVETRLARILTTSSDDGRAADEMRVGGE